MLRIEIINDDSGDDLVGNYDYCIYINSQLISKGRIEEHLRTSGWQGLLSCLDKKINKDRFRQ